MSKWRNGLGLSVAVAALGAVCVAPAMAQDVSDSDEIVVTAQLREQRLVDVPASISAITAEDAFVRGVTQLDNLTTSVPSLRLERTNTPATISLRIRGLGPFANIPYFEPSVGFFIDGAYRSRSGIGVGDLVDIERVEILRGPQSTLYGKNVTAGLLSVVTQAPTRDFNGSLEATLGNYNDRELRASISGPLSQIISGRLSAVVHERDGWMEDLYSGQDNNELGQFAVRGQILFDFSPTTSLRLIAGMGGKDAYCCAPELQPGAFSQSISATRGVPIDTDPTNRVIAHDSPYLFNSEQSDVIARFRHEFAGAVFESITSYDQFEFDTRTDGDLTAVATRIVRDSQVTETFSQEVRLMSGGDSAIDWLIGAYYSQNNFVRGGLDLSEPYFELGPDYGLLGSAGAPGDAARFRSETDTESYSVFGQLTWSPIERLDLTAGLRWFEDTRDWNISSVTNAGPTSGAAGATVPAPLVGSRSTDRVTWNVSAHYDLTDNFAMYGAVAYGVKAGGFNGDGGGLSVAQRQFRDERITNYEAGVRGALFDRSVRISAALFQQDIEDLQNASYLGSGFIVRNAAEVTVSGLEFEGSWRVTPNLSFSFQGTLLDAVYDSFVNGPCAYGQTPDNPVERTCDRSGQKLPLAPERSFGVGAQYEWPMFNGHGFVRADYNWSDKYLTDTTMRPDMVQDEYGLANLRFGWRGDRLEIVAWGRNLTDETVVTISAAQTSLGGRDGGQQHFLNDPRTYGVTARVRF